MDNTRLPFLRGLFLCIFVIVNHFFIIPAPVSTGAYFMSIILLSSSFTLFLK